MTKSDVSWLNREVFKIYPQMEKVYYPKVLVVGQIFSYRTGGGITMSNLFKGWPADRLAVASASNLLNNADRTVCQQYFQLGYNGKLHPFPLGLILPRIKCGPVEFTETNKNNKPDPLNKSGKFKSIYSIVRRLLLSLGINNFLYRLKITPEFKEWLVRYDPDIIYSQLETLELISLVTDIQKTLNKPVAIHIMDDWPSTINKPGLLYSYWKKRTDYTFRDLLVKSSVFMSIGDAMSQEYKRRYNIDFIPFHNPIAIDQWLPFSKTNWDAGETFTILYAGRLGNGVSDSVGDIVNAVNDLNTSGFSIVFELQTPDILQLHKNISLNDHIKWTAPIPYSDLAKKFASVDMLVIPFDFDKSSIAFLRYSFSTKVPEYMISGTPVLVYADKQTALADYASRGEWASLVTEKSIAALKESIKELYLNESLRRRLGEKARKMVVLTEDAEIVRENFRKCLTLN